MTTQHHRDISRPQFANYLRRLADAVDAGTATGEVHVEIGREWVQDRAATGERSYRATVTGAEHTITVKMLRHIEVAPCNYCGSIHEQGACSAIPKRVAP